jgi:1,2-dihydroxy-3-keto-5-methylthiopentene dioxygenase
MSNLRIYADDSAEKYLFQTDDAKQIAQHLAVISVRFERWQAAHAITDAMTPEDILAAYAQDIARLKAEGGYQAVDAISLSADHPDKAALRQKFLSEHTHGEDEVRFFVKGSGLFCLHVGDKVYQIECCQRDLISVPANTPHWFDMGQQPNFTAIRLFNNPDGWVAKFTGSPIATRFPLYE